MIFHWLVLRGFVGGTGAWIIFEAYKRLPIGDAYALFQTTVIWTMLISWIWLKDKPHWTGRDLIFYYYAQNSFPFPEDGHVIIRGNKNINPYILTVIYQTDRY